MRERKKKKKEYPGHQRVLCRVGTDVVWTGGPAGGRVTVRADHRPGHSAQLPWCILADAPLSTSSCHCKTILLKWWSLCTPSSCRSCSLEASLSLLHPAPICAQWQSPIHCCSAWFSLGSLGNALYMYGLLYLPPQSGSRPRTAEPYWVSFLTPGLHTCLVSCQSPVALWFRCCANNLTLIRCLVSRDKMLLCWALWHHWSFWSCRTAVPENKTAGTSGWRVYRRAFQPLASPLKPHQRYRELSLDQTELWTQCLCGSRLLFLGKSQLEATRARPQPESQLDAAWPLLLSARWVLRPTPGKNKLLTAGGILQNTAWQQQAESFAWGYKETLSAQAHPDSLVYSRGHGSGGGSSKLLW